MARVRVRVRARVRARVRVRVRARVRARVRVRVGVRIRFNPNPNPNPYQLDTLHGAADGGPGLVLLTPGVHIAPTVSALSPASGPSAGARALTCAAGFDQRGHGTSRLA